MIAIIEIGDNLANAIAAVAMFSAIIFFYWRILK